MHWPCGLATSSPRGEENTEREEETQSGTSGTLPWEAKTQQSICHLALALVMNRLMRTFLKFLVINKLPHVHKYTSIPTFYFLKLFLTKYFHAMYFDHISPLPTPSRSLPNQLYLCRLSLSQNNKTNKKTKKRQNKQKTKKKAQTEQHLQKKQTKNKEFIYVGSWA